MAWIHHIGAEKPRCTLWLDEERIREQLKDIDSFLARGDGTLDITPNPKVAPCKRGPSLYELRNYWRRRIRFLQAAAGRLHARSGCTYACGLQEWPHLHMRAADCALWHYRDLPSVVDQAPPLMLLGQDFGKLVMAFDGGGVGGGESLRRLLSDCRLSLRRAAWPCPRWPLFDMAFGGGGGDGELLRRHWSDCLLNLRRALRPWPVRP